MTSLRALLLWFSLKLTGEETLRACQGIRGGGRVGSHALAPFGWGVESVSCSLIETNLDVSAQRSALIHQSSAPLWGNLFVSGPLEDTHGCIRAIAIVEPVLQAAPRVKD